MPPTTISIGWRHVFRVGGMVILLSLVVLGLLAFGSAWFYSYAVLHPGCQGDRASLAEKGFDSEPVSFPSRHGPTLRGWFSRGRSHPEIAIIVITGHAGNTRFALEDASIIAAEGYSTLIYEHRSCADPSLSASTGYYEADDLLGAVDYAKSRPDIKHIGVWGYSEGGTASLLAAPQDPAIEAVVAMGGYASLKGDILKPDVKELNLLDHMERQLIVWTMDIQLGVPVETSSPVDVIGKISPRPILLVYGQYEADNGNVLYQAAGNPKDLWIVPGSSHGGYLGAAPDEYRKRIPAFFNRVFGVSP